MFLLFALKKRTDQSRRHSRTAEQHCYHSHRDEYRETKQQHANNIIIFLLLKEWDNITLVEGMKSRY